VHDGIVRREPDHLVEVDGDLAAPTLEVRKHDAYAWVGFDNLQLLMESRVDEDVRLCDIKGVELSVGLKRDEGRCCCRYLSCSRVRMRTRVTADSRD
jgi:hypothetical protein